MRLTAENVNKVIRDCLFKDNELVDGKPTSEPAVGEGVMQRCGFNKERLESHRQDVKEMLSELPTEFMKDEGGGWSFLNACMTKDGSHWGEHRDIDALFMLGQALGFVQNQLPRSMWAALPGGLPYFSVDLQSVQR